MGHPVRFIIVVASSDLFRHRGEVNPIGSAQYEFRGKDLEKYKKEPLFPKDPTDEKVCRCRSILLRFSWTFLVQTHRFTYTGPNLVR